MKKIAVYITAIIMVFSFTFSPISVYAEESNSFVAERDLNRAVSHVTPSAVEFIGIDGEGYYYYEVILKVKVPNDYNNRIRGNVAVYNNSAQTITYRSSTYFNVSLPAASENYYTAIVFGTFYDLSTCYVSLKNIIISTLYGGDISNPNVGKQITVD